MGKRHCVNAERTRTVQVFTRIELEGIHYAAVVDIRPGHRQNIALRGRVRERVRENSQAKNQWTHGRRGQKERLQHTLGSVRWYRPE